MTEVEWSVSGLCITARPERLLPLGVNTRW
jgi:hypothetical protein